MSKYQIAYKDTALKIGMSCLEAVDRSIEEKRFMGSKLVIPIKIPRSRKAKELKYLYPRYDDIILNVEIKRPIIAKCIGLGEYKFLSIRQALKEIENLE